MTDFSIDETARDDGVELGLVGDLEDVAFVDSSGLGLLIATHERASGADVDMAITGAGPEIQRVFTIAGLDGVLTVRPA